MSSDRPSPSRRPNRAKLVLREVSIYTEDAQALIRMLEDELRGEYAPEHMHGVDFDTFEKGGGVFVVAYVDECPVACGALRPYDTEQVELKRMFVTREYRGRGIARQVLTWLEEKARQLGYVTLVLETGDEQRVAMQLYRTSGYHKTAPYGEYQHSPRSVCFVKQL